MSFLPPMEAICKRCRELKPISEFRKRHPSNYGKSWHSPIQPCRECENYCRRRWLQIYRAFNPISYKGRAAVHRPRIIALFKHGLRAPVIAERLGCSEHYVRQVAAATGHKFARQRSWRLDDLAKVRELRAKRYSYRHVASIMGLTVGQIAGVIDRWGLNE